MEARPPETPRPTPRGDRRLVLGAFALIAVAYVASVPGVLFVKPDTMVYMGLARSLARGEGYTFNLQPYAKYPPVFPTMLAVVYAACGESIRAMQTLVALTGVGALAAAFVLLRPRVGTRPALGVAVLTALCPWFWSHSSAYILADVPYTFFSLLSLWAAERLMRSERRGAGGWVLVAALATVAIYTHLAGVALVAALMLGALLAPTQSGGLRRRAMAAGIVGLVCTAAVAAWLWRGVRRDAGAEMSLRSYTYHLREQAAKVDEAPAAAALRLQEWVSTALSAREENVSRAGSVALVGLLVAPGLVWALRREWRGAEFYLCAHLVVVTLLGGEGGRHRYVVPVLPLLYYYGYLSLTVLGGWAAGVWHAAFRPHSTYRPSPQSLRAEEKGTGTFPGKHLPGRCGGMCLSPFPRRLVAVVGIGVFCYTAAHLVRGKRGARVFSRTHRARAAGTEAAWRELRQWALRETPKGTVLCAGSGGSWSIVHFFTERATVAPLADEVTPEDLVADLVRWDPDYVVADTREYSQRRLWPMVRRYAECFPEEGRNRLWTEHPAEEDHQVWSLRRVDRRRLRALAARLKAKQTTKR